MTTPGGPDSVFRAGLAEGKLRIQKCGACAKHIYYPRVLCTACGSADLSWVEPSGRGVVYSVTVLRRRPEQGGDYNVCLIDLDEGARVMSRVEEVAADAVRIGMPVEAFVGIVAGEPGLLFRPARSA